MSCGGIRQNIVPGSHLDRCFSGGTAARASLLAWPCTPAGVATARSALSKFSAILSKTRKFVPFSTATKPPDVSTNTRAREMLVAHRIRLDSNKLPATYCARAAGTARFAYNWALSEWRKQYEACKPIRRCPSLPKRGCGVYSTASSASSFPGC